MVRRRWVKIERGVVSRETFDAVLPRHAQYVRGLQAEGRRVSDGYWGGYGGGMMVFDAESEQAARAIVEADPLVSEKCVEYELKEWRLVAEPHPGFHHVALRVSDLERSEQFYVAGFDMRVEWRPDPDNVYLTSGADNLALHVSPAVTAGPAGALDHIGFVVSRKADVDLFAERMLARGVRFAHAVKDHRDGARSCYVLDPDGNTVQIIYHPPLSGADV